MEPIWRREMLWRCTYRIGGLALTGMFPWRSVAASNPWAARSAHFPARARAVIFLFMAGGPSQIDTFDPKPRLQQEHGKPLPFKSPPTTNGIGNTIMASPFAFKQYGQCGAWVSELFPHLARHVDKMAFIHSMYHQANDHPPASCFIATGHERPGRPSLGAWVLYGLGTTSTELPGFVAFNEGLQVPDRLTAGFLPASYQATKFHNLDNPVVDLNRREASAELQKRKLDFIRELNRQEVTRGNGSDLMEAAGSNFERAIAMQTAVPKLADLCDESSATKKLYGIDDKVTRKYGTTCLLARRLVERGVRFILINTPNWDQHLKLEKGHRQLALETDKPIAGLLSDLHNRGLLDETLVFWGGEFGRTPNVQGADGRDHNPHGYTIWLAGGGVKPGIRHGATDDYGYFAVKDRVSVYDFNATLLHLLGLDHTKLTYRFGGRDYRLTDVHGEIIRPLLA